MSKFQEYLKTFQTRFNFVALSETWLMEDRGIHFNFEKYKLLYVSRTNRKGGGVALFVCSDLKCKIVECMTTAIEYIGVYYS